MSTRGAIGFHIDGEDKLTYNHSDSYPSGLGIDMLEFARKVDKRKNGWEKLKESARNIRLVTDEVPPTEEDIKKFAPYFNGNVAGGDPADWYCLLRHAQGNLQAYIECGAMEDSHTFMQDSLFCEWAYVFNLDENCFEVYKGFNKSPGGAGRYANFKDENGYYGVTLAASWPLNQLPTKADILNLEQCDE